MRRPLRFMLALGVCSLGAQAVAADVYELDPIKSHATFDVKVMWLVGIRGDFGAVKGRLVIDRFSDTATVEADIDANDLHMRTRSYEAWAKSDEFFDTGKFPTIHFVSDKFPIARMRHGGELDGTLTLRGVERPVHLAIDEADCDEPLRGECAVEAFGAIHRSEFGMESRRGALSDKVQLRLSAFVKTASAP